MRQADCRHAWVEIHKQSCRRALRQGMSTRSTQEVRLVLCVIVAAALGLHMIFLSAGVRAARPKAAWRETVKSDQMSCRADAGCSSVERRTIAEQQHIVEDVEHLRSGLKQRHEAGGLPQQLRPSAQPSLQCHDPHGYQQTDGLSCNTNAWRLFTYQSMIV